MRIISINKNRETDISALNNQSNIMSFKFMKITNKLQSINKINELNLNKFPEQLFKKRNGT